MRHNQAYDCSDPEVVRRLIEKNPWATLVSRNDSGAGDGLLASHYPILLDEDAEELAILTHLGRPDDQLHGIGEGELLVIVQGEHGTVGIRLRVDRFTCKRKLSQDKDPTSRRNVIDHLRAPGPYRHPALADEVERELDAS